MSNIDPIGSPSAPLWLITARPHTKDKTLLLSRATGTGKEFHRCLALAELPVPIYVYSLATTPVLKKDEAQFRARADEYREKLITHVAEHKPNIVLLMGEAFSLIEPEMENLQKWRGHVYWSSTLNCKVLPTYHPTMVVSNFFTSDDANPGTYRPIFIADLQKAGEEALQSGLCHDQYQITTLPSATQVEQWTDQCLSEATVLSYDIETASPYRAGVIDCIGFAYRPDSAICIALYSPHNLAPIYDQYDMLRVWRCIYRLLTSHIPKVAQNSQYDTLTLLHNYNIPTQNVAWDTMIAASNIEADFPRDLGFLISLYTNLPQHKTLFTSKRQEDRWEYNGADCIANLHVMVGQKRRMRELGILEHFEEITMPTLEALVYLQHRGIRLDLAGRALAVSYEEAIMNGIKAILNDTLPWPDHNPGSAQQAKALFYGACAERPIYNKGKLTADKHAMLAISKRTVYRGVGMLAELHSLYTASRAVLSAMKTPGERIHTKYGLGGQDIEGEHSLGTDTGRLNSREPDIYALTPEGPRPMGRNLQNLNPGPQRAQLIPDPGYEFAVADLYSAEAIVVALEAGEELMLTMLNEGVKIHQWLLDYVKEHWPAECAEFHYDYSAAKKSIHTMNYAGGPGIMRAQQDIPYKMAEDIYIYYHSVFPGIARRQEWIRTQVQETFSVRSILGRLRHYHRPDVNKILKAAYATPSQSFIGEHTNRALARLHYAHQAGLCPLIPAMNTHDGVVCQSPIGARDAARKWLTWAFATRVTFRHLSACIPIEIAFGPNFHLATSKSTPTEIIRYE